MRKGETEQQQKVSLSTEQSEMHSKFHYQGVNVIIKGTTKGTTTDINGNYFIEVPHKNTVLVFSYIGFESQEIKVGDQININVNMSEESNNLDEVVVVGYGSQKKSIRSRLYHDHRTCSIATRNNPCRFQ